MLSKDKQHREAMKMIAGIREGNIKITVAMYGGTAVVVGGGAIAAKALPALASACVANPVACTTIGVDSADTLGFQKMQVMYELYDGQTITVHYQYNFYTAKTYDIKITTPQRTSANPHDVLNSIKEKVK